MKRKRGRPVDYEGRVLAALSYFNAYYTRPDFAPISSAPCSSRARWREFVASIGGMDIEDTEGQVMRAIARMVAHPELEPKSKSAAIEEAARLLNVSTAAIDQVIYPRKARRPKSR